MTSVMVAGDSDDLFGAGLMRVLAAIEEFRIARRRTSMTEAATYVKQLKPDVVVLLVCEQSFEPATAIRAIRMASASTAVVVVTTSDTAPFVLDLLDAGASAYLFSNVTTDELASAVRSSLRPFDNVYINVPRAAIGGLARQDDVQRVLSPREHTLSPREHEVLQLLHQAMSNRDIGSRLGITEATVKRHLTNIATKLGTRTRIATLRAAQAAHILPD